MVKFAQCSVPIVIQDNGELYRNFPVNLCLVGSIQISRGSRAIIFDGIGVEWAFNTEGQRDAEFDRLMITYGDIGEQAIE